MGFNPVSPTKYRGTDQYLVPVVKRQYTPTTADYRQPETGRNYPLGCLWILSANPTDGLQGDIYILAKIVSNLATWVPYNTGISGPLLSLTVDAATAPGTIVVLPTSTTGTITVTGGQVSASSIGANAIQTKSVAQNSFGILIQQAGSGASASSSLNGIASFSTAAFSISAGFVTLNAINLSTGVTGILPVANGGTGVGTLTGYLVGNGTSAITGLGASTDNAVAVTNNSGAAALVANGTPGYVFTANSGAPPSWQPAPGSSTGFTIIVDRIFTSSGTYTPTASMKYCIVECIGGGGGGAGVTSSSTSFYVGGGGGGGGYARIVLTAASIGASKAVTIGAAGTGGLAGTNNGGTGGATSLGTLCVAGGGLGGISSTALGVSAAVLGGNGGSGTVGDFFTTGTIGGYGIASSSDSSTISGCGGSTFFGGAGNCVIVVQSSGSIAGNNATSYGGGGSGAVANSINTSPKAGGNGFAGIVIITEYI